MGGEALNYRVLPSCIIVWQSNPERWPDTLEVCIAPDSMMVWMVGHKVEWL
jgi:hypothetical protein